MKKSLVIKIVSCISAVAILFFACSSSGGFFRGGSLPRLSEPMEFKEVSEAEFMRSFRPRSRLLVASADDTTLSKDILDNTRYSPTSWSTSTPWDAYQDFWDLLQYEKDSGLFDPDLVRSKKFQPSNIITEAVKQRAKDLVDNANNGNTKALQDTYCFIAKRKIFYPASSDYEVDYLYCWYDYNHTNNGSFEGITLGNFYMQPNTIVLCRFNSNGYSTTAYTSADEFPLSLSTVINFSWNMQKKDYSIVNSDGTVETLEYSKLNSGDYFPRGATFFSDRSTNSISDEPLLYFYNENRNSYNQMFGNILTNIQCICTNGLYIDNNNSCHFIGNDWATAKWYISSGGFFPNADYGLSINQNFSTDTNIQPSKAPVYNNYNTTNNTFKSNTYLTTENVSNYADYGITYNNTSGKFELDLDALAVGVAAEIEPKFQLAFDGVYNAQPLPDANFNGDLDINYNQTIDDTINQLIDKYYPPASGWEPPSYPAVNTSAFIPATYPTFEVSTIPPDYGEVLGETLTNGWDMADSLGLTAILVPFTILILLWRFTGK